MALLAVALVVLIVVAPAGALMLSPALALVFVVALGAFPSNEMIHWVRRRLRRARVAAARVAAPVVAVGRRPRVGRAIAFALSVRPPPAARSSLI